MMAFSFSAICLSALICAVMIAPLDEASAHFFSIVPFEANRAAPFNEMLSPENVLIIGPSPDDNQRRVAAWAERPIYKRSGRGYYNLTDYFGCVRGKKEPAGRLIIVILSRKDMRSRQFIWTAIFLVGVFPAFFNLGRAAKRVI
jgi:hypothetical protein